ncbi:MAG: HAMP domain-containing histidine kinase [Acidobacteriota bacterium]|nr:HAMP domain-containing histidine kinase [Acidobacteriota bacterium]
MIVRHRRKVVIFFIVFGICLVALAVALNVGWILLNLQQIALLVLGIIFFAIIITGLVLNTIFLVREIRRNEQHDTFINAVTHELKTPIASLRLYLETLKKRDLPEEKRQEFYDLMLGDTDRLLAMVEQVLYAGRSRDKRRKINLSKVKINQLLQDSAKMIRNRYNLDETALELPQNGDVRVRGDRLELQVAFTNLLDNAVKYSKDAVKVRVEIENFDEKRIEIKVKDEGIGIAPTEIKNIFRRFYRPTNRFTRKIKGTGLGLSIVQGIVEKHGGKIFAQSAGEGKGSTFIIRLPKA